MEDRGEYQLLRLRRGARAVVLVVAAVAAPQDNAVAHLQLDWAASGGLGQPRLQRTALHHAGPEQRHPEGANVVEANAQGAPAMPQGQREHPMPLGMQGDISRRDEVLRGLREFLEGLAHPIAADDRCVASRRAVPHLPRTRKMRHPDSLGFRGLPERRQRNPRVQLHFEVVQLTDVGPFACENPRQVVLLWGPSARVPLRIWHLDVGEKEVEERAARRNNHRPRIEIASLWLHAATMAHPRRHRAPASGLRVAHRRWRPHIEQVVYVLQDQRVEVQEDDAVVRKDLGVEYVELREHLLEVRLVVGRCVEVGRRLHVGHLHQVPQRRQKAARPLWYVARMEDHAVVRRATRLEAVAQREGAKNEVRRTPVQQRHVGKPRRHDLITGTCSNGARSVSAPNLTAKAGAAGAVKGATNETPLGVEEPAGRAGEAQEYGPKRVRQWIPRRGAT
mmetsp:Transcript_115660/g.327011  ORF Transcript_115660/g.327011 Transcript_115660/m.327011 type:complete len:449 (+) Transcript_115660:620-1966(+)